MGCGSSSDAGSPSADNEIDCETKKVTSNQNKNKDNMEDGDDMFVSEDAEGEQFMAVRPWIGQIEEPDNHNEVNNDKPDVTYELEYAYGYRCFDTRQNVHFNADGNAVYMAAALGVILDHGSNTQKFFGGGEVDNTSK